MVRFLAKIFIKNSSDFKDNLVREKYGILCGILGVFFNVVLCVVKFIFGTLASSVAMVADSINNLSDAASSFVQILGFKFAAKKPDREHPFGHGRIEYIAGLIISFFILYMGIDLIRRSITSIFEPQKVEFSYISLIIMIGAIFVKIYIYFYNHSIGKKIESLAMEATAKDSLNDVIVTSVVVLSIILSKFTTFPVDSVSGIIVGIFIFKTGFESVKEIVSSLLGKAPTQELVNQLERIALSHKPISEIHDVTIHDYGPGRKMITLHAEVPGNMNIFELHDAIDAAEEDISQKFNCQILIHMDPVDVENKNLEKQKQIIKEEAFKINPKLKVHDVRLVKCSDGTKLFFELLKPADFKISNEELKNEMIKAVQEKLPNVECILKEINLAYL